MLLRFFKPFFCVFKSNKYIKAFSLIELLISLIVISCITAAFTPVITKKLKVSAVALNSSSSEITTECAAKFSSACKLCTKSYCIQCELSNCAVGKYAENKTCSCKDCSTLFSNCSTCDSTKCTKCNVTHYIKDGKCEICPSDKVCDGVNAYDASYCNNPPVGYFCDGNTPRKCTEKYNGFCSTCNSTQCTGCQDYYFLSGGTCKPCVMTACTKCNYENYCTACQQDWVFDPNTHSCTKVCGTVIPSCKYCSDATTCTKCKGTHYLNSSNGCSSCSSAIENCFSCSNAATCTRCNKGYYVNSSNKCSQCTVANCAQCDKDGTCLACNQGFHPSFDKRSCTENDDSFNCSDSNFMRIGKLCVTRKNMGDSSVLPIPSTVVTAKAGSDYCYSAIQKCCWKGATSNDHACDSENGNYSGCTRTVCNWDAAKEICAKFNYGGKIWRLPTHSEMANWAINSIGLKENGLMLCDINGGYNSSACTESFICKGAYNNSCNPTSSWGSVLSGASHAQSISLYGADYNLITRPVSAATSVRCVTEMD